MHGHLNVRFSQEIFTFWSYTVTLRACSLIYLTLSFGDNLLSPATLITNFSFFFITQCVTKYELQ